ncbi:MAG TPA: hypothetical protein VHM30_05465 [Gemmatimonadaceae bacterium]|nr:hypothetical protein [Gemmatimonadaceae bacterium]
MRRLLVATLALAAAACTDATTQPRGSELPTPTGLTYQLVPSGFPDSPDGVLLTWNEVTDSRVVAYVVYSRSSDGRWQRRAETTSPTFHDAGYPAPGYYVASRDDAGHESVGSASVSIDVRLRMPAPTALTSVSLYRAAQLSWSSASRLTQPAQFSYYRVYSTVWSNAVSGCDNDLWVLEGTTISDDFLATGLTNGVRYCFAVSIVSQDGHESLWSTPRDETPRYDSRNVILDAFELFPATSGFDFYNPTANPQFGIVTSGSSTSIDFRLERHADGLLYLVPRRSDVAIALYSQDPVTDLTSIDIAPLDNAFGTAAISASPGYAYVFRIGPVGSANYAAVRISHVGADYVILDWSYQSATNNPELVIAR